MSRRDVEIVRTFFERLMSVNQVEQPREDVIDGLVTPDVVYVEDPKWPGSDTYRGRDAVTECWSRYDDILGETVNAEITDVRDAGERVVAVVSVAGRARESGLPFDHTWGYLCEVEGDRLSSFRAYFEPSEALRAAGLES